MLVAVFLGLCTSVWFLKGNIKKHENLFLAFPVHGHGALLGSLLLLYWVILPIMPMFFELD
jgi:hypothetical protein